MLYYCCSTAFEKYEILNKIYIIKKKQTQKNEQKP